MSKIKHMHIDCDSSVDSAMIVSPCIRNCCLNDDDVCMGCFRSLDEILGWSSSDDKQRLQIISRCHTRQNIL